MGTKKKVPKHNSSRHSKQPKHNSLEEKTTHIILDNTIQTHKLPKKRVIQKENKILYRAIYMDIL